MEKKIYSRPTTESMIIALNEVLMISGGPAGAPPGTIDPESLL